MFVNVFFHLYTTKADIAHYFIPQGPTSVLTSSRKDVKQLVYFQILQNADIFFYSVIILLWSFFQRSVGFTASIASCNLK